MRVAVHNNEAIVRGAVNSTRVSNSNQSKVETERRNVSKGSKLSNQEMSRTMRKMMNQMQKAEINKDVPQMNVVGHSKLATNLNSS